MAEAEEQTTDAKLEVRIRLRSREEVLDLVDELLDKLHSSESEGKIRFAGMKDTEGAVTFEINVPYVPGAKRVRLRGA